jgi:hypothetical protein
MLRRRTIGSELNTEKCSCKSSCNYTGFSAYYNTVCPDRRFVLTTGVVLYILTRRYTKE